MWGKGLLFEWCRWDTNRLLGEAAANHAIRTMLATDPAAVEALAEELGLSVVRRKQEKDACLDLCTCRIYVASRLRGIGRIFATARELGHYRMHRRAPNVLEAISRQQTREAVVWAVTLLQLEARSAERVEETIVCQYCLRHDWTSHSLAAMIEAIG